MEKNTVNTSHSSTHRGKLIFGSVLMLVGLLFLGFNFGIIPQKLRWIIFSWQMLLILIGLVQLTKKNVFSGLTLLIIGSFFLMPRLITTFPDVFPVLNPDFASVFWPVLLIAAGLLIVSQRLLCPKKHCHHDRHHRKNYRKVTQSDSEFEKNTIFGKSEYIVLDPEFKGAELNAIFGEIKFDLRKTTLPEGDTHLDVNSVFGGIVVFVPQDWNIEIQIDPVFGGYKDYRMPVESPDPKRRLIITGACVFGGAEINN